MRGRDSVRRTGVVDVLGALDETGRLHGRILHRNDLVVLAMDQERRDVELLEIGGEVGLGEGLDGFVRVPQTSLHAPEPELIEDSLRDHRAGAGAPQCGSPNSGVFQTSLSLPITCNTGGSSCRRGGGDAFRTMASKRSSPWSELKSGSVAISPPVSS